MKKSLALRVVALALFFVGAFLSLAVAQTTVNRQPWFVAKGAWLDVGNGPLVVVALNGNGNIYSIMGSGVGSTSGSSTTLTLTSTAAADPPCVGCLISGTGITAGTTVAAFNGTTTITLSAAMTVASSTALTWGMACPTSGAPTSSYLSTPVELRATGSIPPAAVPMGTSARVCAYGGGQGGLTGANFGMHGW